jgi:hypothetical protein
MARPGDRSSRPGNGRVQCVQSATSIHRATQPGNSTSASRRPVPSRRGPAFLLCHYLPHPAAKNAWATSCPAICQNKATAANRGKERLTALPGPAPPPHPSPALERRFCQPSRDPHRSSKPQRPGRLQRSGIHRHRAHGRGARSRRWKRRMSVALHLADLEKRARRAIRSPIISHSRYRRPNPARASHPAHRTLHGTAAASPENTTPRAAAHFS